MEYDKIEYDLATIAILGLGDSERSQNDILKLLSVLMEPKMETERKKRILETEFAIPMTVEMEREASEMCTLGESIARENLEKGMALGRTEGQYAIVKRMLQRGRSIQEVVEDTGVSETEVKKLAKSM